MIPLKESKNGITLAVKVHPRAKKNTITGIVGDTLKLSLTAPPIEGRANEAVVEFFAKLLRLPRASITIAAGAGSRNKLICASGVSVQSLHQILEQAFEGSNS